MISGRQTLASINSSLQELRRKVSQLEQQIGERGNRLLVLQQEEVQNYRELGKLRVKILAADQQFMIPDDAERTIQGLLEKRQSGLEKIRDDITAAEQLRSDLEQRRQQQAIAVEEAAEAVDDAEKKTQDRLNDDSGYQKQLQITQEIERTLKHADSKATQREEALANKGKPYRDDSLFMYLWNRKYSTVEYQATSLTRWLDGKVAKLIHYEEARVNFSKLQKIPHRLRQHADQVKEKARQEFELLQSLETKAREEDGIPVQEQNFEKEEADLAAIDGEIDKAVIRQEELEKQQTNYSTGRDQYYQKAVDYLTTELRRDNLKDLRLQAQATPFPEDDLIISRLLQLEAQEQDVQDGLIELKNFHSQQQQRLHEMETLQSDFKRNRYDSAGTVFSDPAVIAATLGQVINGVLNSDTFRHTLEKQRRSQPRRADPGFGSGGLGRGTIWGRGMRFPSSGGRSRSGRRGGFSFPSGQSKRRNSGGFSTGGGF